MPTRFIIALVLLLAFSVGADPAPITFNTNFEGASIGLIETLAPATFRLHVRGQYNEQGRNRQTTWYYLRFDHVKDQDLTITLTDFVGEYDGRPALPMSDALRPVTSPDGKTWTHADAAEFDKEKKELILHLKPTTDSLYLAHIPPYTPRDLHRLLADIAPRGGVRIETIGKTALGRDIPMVTITDFGTPDDAKKVVWLQARQHAWEAGTSYVMEGALRFITSDDPAAQKLRQQTVFCFTPMVDIDGCAAGNVRFNANGYDVNRHWPEVNLRDPLVLKLMPEIWYTKKAIIAKHREKPIDLLLNLHNTETGEYVASEASGEPHKQTLTRLFDALSANTSFDPSSPLRFITQSGGTTNSLYSEQKIPAALMEQRISAGKKMGHFPTIEDRLAFGKDLIQQMAQAVQR